MIREDTTLLQNDDREVEEDSTMSTLEPEPEYDRWP
jgi:hypothetical protein